MQIYRYTTPGTRLSWSNVSEWVEAARALDRRRCSEARSRALRNHGGVMPREMIQRETDAQAIEAALDLLKYGPPGLARPPKGARGTHPTTPVIMDLMNRLAVLGRDEELPRGDNWTAMFGQGTDEQT